MKRQSDEEKLISELLAGDGELARATLAHGLTLSRRKRARRRAWRAACFLAPVALLAALLIHFRAAERSPLAGVQVSKHSPAQPEVISGTSIRVLSDAELLDFFKDRPVALVGRAGNQKLILFDESQN